MDRFNNTQPTVKSFQDRLSVAMVFVLVCFGLLLLRFVWLQIFTHNRHSVAAENNRIALVPVPASRGLIIDRNGVVIARNYSAYTLEINPSQIEGNVNELLDELSNVVDIQPKDRKNFLKLLNESKTFSPYNTLNIFHDTYTGIHDFSILPGKKIPISALLASQMPLTTQPITATVICSTPGYNCFHWGIDSLKNVWISKANS